MGATVYFYFVKTLYIVRHAKSSWEYEQLHDLERPLTGRGERDAKIMGALLRKKQVHPGCVLSSPALRALSTARILCEETGFDRNKIEIHSELYFKDTYDCLALISQRGSRMDNILLVGHNPMNTNLAHLLAHGFDELLPTCGIVSIEFPVESWGLVEGGTGKIKFFEYPKKYR